MRTKSNNYRVSLPLRSIGVVNLFIYFTLALLVSCTANKGNIVSVPTHILPNSSLSNDAPVFRAAIKNALQSGSRTVTVAPGTYRIDSPVWDGEIPDSLIIRGEGEVKLICSSIFGTFKAPFETRILTTPAARGEKQIRFSDLNFSSGFRPASVTLHSDDIVEASWKYPKGETAVITAKGERSVTINKPLNFSYLPGKEKVTAKFYHASLLAVENIQFRQVRNALGNSTVAIATRGCKLKLKNVSSHGETEGEKVDFMNIHSASSVTGSGLVLNYLRYGLLINYSRNVQLRDLTAEDVIHPVAPSTFTTDVKVEKIRGRNTSIDAHVAFNVHYNDVIITENGGFALRAFGVLLTNSKIVPAAGRKAVSRLSVQSLREQYAFLAREYDVTIRNVEYRGELSSRNGLNVFKCRNFLVDNCVTHEVSSSSYTTSFQVVNSRIGRLRCYTNTFNVTDTEFDGQLQGRRDVKPPLWGSYGGLALLESCTFKGYDDTFLIGYINDSKSTRYEFRKCNLGAFAGAVGETKSEGKTYQPLNFVQCKFNGPSLKRSSGFPVSIR